MLGTITEYLMVNVFFFFFLVMTICEPISGLLAIEEDILMNHAAFITCLLAAIKTTLVAIIVVTTNPIVLFSPEIPIALH